MGWLAAIPFCQRANMLSRPSGDVKCQPETWGAFTADDNFSTSFPQETSKALAVLSAPHAYKSLSPWRLTVGSVATERAVNFRGCHIFLKHGTGHYANNRVAPHNKRTIKKFIRREHGGIISWNGIVRNGVALWLRSPSLLGWEADAS